MTTKSIDRCAHYLCQDASKWGMHIFARRNMNNKSDGTRFAACDEHRPLYADTGSTYIPIDRDTAILDLIRDGAVIEAIKYVRASTGWGLKESKDYVDQLRAQIAVCTTCNMDSGRHVPYPPYNGPSQKCPGFTHALWSSSTMKPIEACPHTDHKFEKEVRGTRVIERAFDGSRFSPCSAHEDTWAKDSSYREIKQETPKKMPTRQYGINQKMDARFPGTCFLCKGKIIPNDHVILPLLSERTPRGRHPWVHETCMQKDNNGEKIIRTSTSEIVVFDELDGDDVPVPSSRFLVDPPPVSKRQINVVGRNLEAVLRALAANPSQAYALIPATETTQDAVLTTEAVTPPAKVEVAEAASA